VLGLGFLSACFIFSLPTTQKEVRIQQSSIEMKDILQVFAMKDQEKVLTYHRYFEKWETLRCKKTFLMP
jgi:hypothetical protein